MRLQLEAGSTTPWLRISECYSKLTQDVTKYYFEGSHSSHQILAASHLELQKYQFLEEVFSEMLAFATNFTQFPALETD